MNALSTLHGALRPGGLLLDVHPEPAPRWIEMHLGSQVLPVGQVNTADQIERVMIARSALQTTVDAQLFAHEQERTFDFLYHFASVDAWLNYMTEHGHEAQIGAEVIARARELSPRQGSGELCMRRAVRAARFRRV